MTKRTLEYIVNHYLAAMAAWNKVCLFRKCKKCPFASGNYCLRTDNTNKNIDVINKYLESQKGGKKLKP